MIDPSIGSMADQDGYAADNHENVRSSAARIPNGHCNHTSQTSRYWLKPEIPFLSNRCYRNSKIQCAQVFKETLDLPGR